MMGAYQIIWLDSVPAFAAVNEAVEQGRVRAERRRRVSLNAILRQLLRDIEHRRLPVGQADSDNVLYGERCRVPPVSPPVLTDPGINLTTYLAEVTSHPTWLVGRWIRHFGRAATETICRAGMNRPDIDAADPYGCGLMAAGLPLGSASRVLRRS
jgi:16S rRNA (cytosine967-C5)-methyltransferase